MERSEGYAYAICYFCTLFIANFCKNSVDDVVSFPYYDEGCCGLQEKALRAF